MRTFERDQTITVDIAIDDPRTHAPIDPAEVVLDSCMKDGSWVSVSPTITRISTGHWRAVFPAETLAVGSYLFRFRVSGTDPDTGGSRVALVDDRVVVTHTVFSPPEG